MILSVWRRKQNLLWKLAIYKELGQLNDYEILRTMAVKQCFQMAFRISESLLAKDSIYSSLVSLRSLRMVMFLSELNCLELCVDDIGNAFLEAFTKENVVGCILDHCKDV